jgi:hypothetical protein
MESSEACWLIFSSLQVKAEFLQLVQLPLANLRLSSDPYQQVWMEQLSAELVQEVATPELFMHDSDFD